MECSCIRQTELPGTTRLYADLVYHPDRVRPFYSSPSTVAQAVSQVVFPDERRAQLVTALAELNGPSAELDLLAQPGTVAVVTGQQVGLFSGPAYTVYKALTAVKLARQLTQDGILAVPVFWIATEDHDLAEIDHAWVFNRDFAPARAALSTPASIEANRPVGRIPMESVPLEALRQGLSGHPFADEIFAAAAEAYAPGKSIGGAFQALVKSLLGDYRMLFIDPMRDSVRRLGAPMIAKALAAAPELTPALLARNRELSQAGYHAQVHVEESTSLFFLLEGEKRQALRRSQGEYTHQGRRFSTAELIERAGQISPNALLRPVVQDYMLPTVAYIGGPAELAYLAQSQVLFDRLLGRQPLPVPRAGFTLVDSHSSKLMRRYHLAVPDFFPGEAALRAKIAERLVPPSLASLMPDARATTAQVLDRVKKELLAFDPTLAKALNRSRRKIEYQLEKTQSKIARQAMLRDDRATHDSVALGNLIYPHKHLQERFYSILPFLAKFGPGLMDTIYENIHLDCPDHKLLTV